MARTGFRHIQAVTEDCLLVAQSHLYSPRDQGWVSIIKPKEFKIFTRGEDSNLKLAENSSRNSNGVSLSSPKEAMHYRCS